MKKEFYILPRYINNCTLCHYLEGAWFEKHDLVLLAKLLKSRDAFGKLNHLFDGRSETLREGLPDLLTRAFCPWYRPCIERTGLTGRKTNPGTMFNGWSEKINYINYIEFSVPPVLTRTLAPWANFHGQEVWVWVFPALWNPAELLLWRADWSWFWLDDTK